MNRIINFCLFILLVTSAVSCKSDFEDQPLDITTVDYTFDKNDATGYYANLYVSYIYSRLPIGYARINGVPLETVSDDAVPSNTANANWNVIRGGYTPSSTFDDNWSGMYAGIRNVNIFLNNYKQIPWADPNQPRYLSNEVRALRAWFYYELIKRYGGVPLIGDKVYESTDAELLKLKRNSFDDCVKYIISELDAVKDSLRPEATLASRGSGNGITNGSDPNGGRIRKSTVLGMKTKVLLLAASPLFNASSTPDKDYTGYQSYSLDRWKAAADAAKAVMDLKDINGATMFQLENDRYLLWKTSVNKEVVFMRMGGQYANTYSYWMSPVGYNPGNTASQGLVSPTQELVDAFPMKNGKTITDPISGYNAATPYANRDPRLDQTVFYNGATWLKRAVETFEGGKDKPNNTSIAAVQTQTGYYAKKFLANDANSSTYTNTCFVSTKGNWMVVIRYADILLMYAEAQNEYSGPDASVYSAVEAVRQRAGLSPYALPTGLTQDQMRDVIHNERRVEFAFEEQRFWDIRRWKIAKSTYGATLHGVTITKNINGTFTYVSKNVVTPYYSDAMNLLPIALKETQVNPNIMQNPGY
ncbi:MAG: RagB/SusD family nutrient uptake outer membrane protein [Bacteroidota bacterium]|nr:RagB/SusD family nutrient uptake outer membrane protein [Bacteroidota bacterium]